MEDSLAREISITAEKYKSLVNRKVKSARLRLAVVSGLRQSALRTRQDLRPRGDLGVSAEALIGTDVLDMLSKAVGDSDSRVRVLAIATLSDLAGESSVPVLVKAVALMEGTVVSAALEALGEVGGPAASSALVSAARTGRDVDTRLAALAALERLAAKEASRPDSLLLSVDGSMLDELSAVESNIEEVPFLRIKAAEIRELLEGAGLTSLLINMKAKLLLGSQEDRPLPARSSRT
jgi:HEAT repeat protein